MKQNTNSMLDFTQGSIPKHLFDFTIPLFLGNLLQTFYNTVDSIWVGRFLGPQALAAVSVSFPIIFVLVSFVMGITMATTVLVAQYKGARREDMVKKTINNSMLLLLIGALTVSIFGISFNRQILKLMNTPDSLIPMASGYLNVFLGGLVFMFGYNVTSAILRGLGDSRTPLIFLTYSTAINMALDPLLIFGIGPIPKMGIIGAAVATIISQAISFYLAVRYLDRSNHLITIKFREMKFDMELTKLTIKIGLPAGIQHTVISLGQTVMMSLVNTFGPLVVASYGAAVKIQSFAFMPGMSIGMAVSSLTGQNIGAGREDRIREIVKWAMVLTLVIIGFVALVIAVFPKQLLLMFTKDDMVLKQGAHILRILSVSYIPFGLMWVANGVLRGAGDTFITMVISIVSLWGIRIPLAVYLARFTPLGSTGIWAAMAIGSFISMFLTWGYYLTGRWKGKSAVKKGYRLKYSEE
ncbi:MAG: hypothetical protein PWQ82_1223 [Thermosediminibacterales bacterium]|nr:hypothetical protein [Thermosediminibacterales bacterium]